MMLSSSEGLVLSRPPVRNSYEHSRRHAVCTRGLNTGPQTHPSSSFPQEDLVLLEPRALQEDGERPLEEDADVQQPQKLLDLGNRLRPAQSRAAGTGVDGCDISMALEKGAKR